MQPLELRRCPSCHTTGNWQRSQAQGFIETRVLPLFAISPFRCGSCRRRIKIFGHQRWLPSHGDVFRGGASVGRVSPKEDEDFQRLIAELKKSEKALVEDESR